LQQTIVPDMGRKSGNPEAKTPFMKFLKRLAVEYPGSERTGTGDKGPITAPVYQVAVSIDDVESRCAFS
jgi:hypothetical protein